MILYHVGFDIIKDIDELESNSLIDLRVRLFLIFWEKIVKKH